MKDSYELKHEGTCKEGWDNDVNILAPSKVECFKECIARSKVGYFAYAASRPGHPDNCACYFADKLCPKGPDPAFNSYQIVREGIIEC